MQNNAPPSPSSYDFKCAGRVARLCVILGWSDYCRETYCWRLLNCNEVYAVLRLTYFSCLLSWITRMVMYEFKAWHTHGMLTGSQTIFNRREKNRSHSKKYFGSPVWEKVCLICDTARIYWQSKYRSICEIKCKGTFEMTCRAFTRIHSWIRWFL